MNAEELNAFLKSKSLSKARYYCRIEDLWFALVVNANSSVDCYALCLLLDAPLRNPKDVVEFTPITYNWSTDPNYNAITATSMMRQLDRCRDKCALVSDNLFAIKYNDIKVIGWAKGEVDADKVYTVAKQNDNFTVTSLVHDKRITLNMFNMSIETNWACDDKMASLQQRYLAKSATRKVVHNTLETLGSYDSVEREIVQFERNFFDTCLLKSLETYHMDILNNLLSNKIF